MDYTPEQEHALREVDRWLRDPSRQVFRLFGFAGVGKTTLARRLAENVRGLVLFAAFTGKAAHVLRSKGCEGATTIHSLIYHSKDKSQKKLRELEIMAQELREQLVAENHPDPDEHPRLVQIQEDLERERDAVARPSFTLNTESAVAAADLVIVDECSMVDDRMGEDLLSFGTKVLVLGDPAQLPPVRGAGGFFTEGKPDIMLTQVMRQAAENPILALATRVREGGRLSPGEWGQSRVLAAGTRLAPEEVTSASQVLVGKNATRRMYNQRIRHILQRTSGLPQEGDKLVCLRNDHDLGLLNGSIWECRATIPSELRILMSIRSTEDGREADVEAHAAIFHGMEVPWYERRDAQEFDFGYAMTVHKSQGSQWPDVIVFDESRVFKQDWARWLYTAITRAEERVTISLT